MTAFDNLYDYLGCDPIFDELNSFGRANKARLEATPAPTGDPDPSRLERAFESLDAAFEADPLDDLVDYGEEEA